VAPDDSFHERVDLRPQLGLDEGDAGFGAEDDVVEEAGEGCSHGRLGPPKFSIAVTDAATWEDLVMGGGEINRRGVRANGTAPSGRIGWGERPEPGAKAPGPEATPPPLPP